MPDNSPVVRPATAHGWLRRPELDGVAYDAWELPDGRLHAAPCGETPRLATLPLPADLFRKARTAGIPPER